MTFYETRKAIWRKHCTTCKESQSNLGLANPWSGQGPSTFCHSLMMYKMKAFGYSVSLLSGVVWCVFIRCGYWAREKGLLTSRFSLIPKEICFCICPNLLMLLTVIGSCFLLDTLKKCQKAKTENPTPNSLILKSKMFCIVVNKGLKI